MKFNKLNFIFTLYSCAILLPAGCKTQEKNSWQMKPVVLQSRWAKDVNPSSVLSEYPRPQMERKDWANLNGLWNYTITSKDSAMPSAFSKKILVPFPIESALSGVQKSLLPNQNLWYRRTFKKPSATNGERVLMHFGAVDYQATVYINGKEEGYHNGGYQSFSFDITNDLQDGDNEVVVKVWDPTDQGPNPHGKQVLNPAGIMYTPSSGIWQTVWLETVPTEYITGVKITPDIDNSTVHVTVRSKADRQVEIGIDGKTISGNSNTDISIPINNPKLWSPEDPYLYDMTVKMGKDEVKSYFGMRKISIGKDEKGTDRIFLNNKPYYNLGVLDQGFWPAGLYTAPTDEALQFDIKAIKAMGFNTIRKHIKIEPGRWYYYADKLGMLVWQDMVNPGNTTEEGKEEFEKECKENVEQLYNHPGITTWVLFNEGWGAYDQERLAGWMKQLDPTRILDGHTGSEIVSGKVTNIQPIVEKSVNSDMTDVHSYPPPAIPTKMDGKAQVVGEFGGIGVSVAYHEWNDMKGWGYVQLLPEQLIQQYDSMTRSLKTLEAEGLSASIYTQPFDVEGEENGLMTYDRDMIKIPLNKIREINSLLNPHAEEYKPEANLSIGKDIDPKDNDNRYVDLLKDFENGKKDSAFLRRLTLMALRQKDQVNATKVGNVLINQLKNPFAKNNLALIQYITNTSKDAGFSILINDSAIVNAALGKYSAQNKIMNIISSEEITPHLQNKHVKPYWDSIKKVVVDQYGALGLERMNMEQLVYYWTASPNSDSLAKYYVKYFERAMDHSRIHINNCSWAIFEKVNDQNVLKFAVKVMKYDLEHFDMNAYQSYDTYANLLYKTGNKVEALKWEEKAVKGLPKDKDLAATLVKMKKGEKTWN